MEILKTKYTAVQISSKTINSDVSAELFYGRISGPYYDTKEPQMLHDSEQEAIEWAYKEDEYATWIILPVVKFKHEYNN